VLNASVRNRQSISRARDHWEAWTPRFAGGTIMATEPVAVEPKHGAAEAGNRACRQGRRYGGGEVRDHQHKARAAP
jgi:hypothetical protein